MCESCGLTRRLHVHHIDGDFTNESLSNLQTLCTHCHNFWHALLERHGLKPAEPMPSLLGEVSLLPV